MDNNHRLSSQWNDLQSKKLEGDDVTSEFTQNILNEEMEIKMAMARHNMLSIAASIMCVPSEVFTTPPMIDPNPPSNPIEYERRNRISELLGNGWKATDGYQIPVEEIDGLDDLMGSEGVGQRPSTYGEITELGSRQLFHYMGLGLNSETSENSGNIGGEEEVFVDLGCGNGKLLLQAYMELPNVCRILGIELAKARFTAAIQAWEKLKSDATDIRLGVDGRDLVHANPDNGDDADTIVDIQEGDLFEMDISTATHVYIASLCFTDDMMRRLAQKLVDEGRKLKVVGTLKPFPERFDQYLGTPSKKLVEMSWTKSRGNGCTVYFYNV
jgi:SAM-dependent methyltransferase